MTAKEFYEANATNVMNIEEGGSGDWGGVRRASPAKCVFKDALVMTLQDAWDFAEKFAARGAK